MLEPQVTPAVVGAGLGQVSRGEHALDPFDQGERFQRRPPRRTASRCRGNRRLTVATPLTRRYVTSKLISVTDRPDLIKHDHFTSDRAAVQVRHVRLPLGALVPPQH
jgi:hypothetical protein